MAIRRFSNASITSAGGKSSKFWDQETSLGYYESIAVATAGGSESVLEFTSIPNSYTHLQVRFISKDIVVNSTRYESSVRLNGDNGGNYSNHSMYGDGSTANANGFTNETVMRYGFISGVSLGGSTTFVSGTFDLLDYSNTTKNKTARTVCGIDANGSGGAIYMTSGSWRSTAVVNSLSFYSQTGFVAGSTFALYGIRGA